MLPILFFLAIFGLGATALPTPINERAAIAVEAPVVELAERGDDFNVVRDELVDGPCQKVTVIFARGTLELGNVGSLAGPPFFNALISMVGSTNMAVQGVDYGATVAGYLEGGDPTGAATLASLVNLAVSKCPSTQIVLSGYSQGAQVVHLGVKQISAAAAAHVSAVVFFGDPDDAQALANITCSKDETYCFDTDLICDGLPIVLPAHLSYAIDAQPAANFVSGMVTV